MVYCFDGDNVRLITTMIKEITVPEVENNNVTVTIIRVNNGYILRYVDKSMDAPEPLEITQVYEDDGKTHDAFMVLLCDLIQIFGENEADEKGKKISIKTIK